MATLSPGAWEDHEAAIREFGDLRLGGEQGSGDDGGFGESAEEKVDYDADVEEELGQDGEDGAGGEQDSEWILRRGDEVHAYF